MSTAVRAQAGFDQTDAAFMVRGSFKLGIVESVIVLVFALAARFLGGIAGLAVEAVLLIAGLAAVTVLPGLWTRARTIEGIAGAATIGFFATIVFMLVDVIFFQTFHLYTHRWLAIGGGSNWWYHPVWWMAGTFMPWLGAWMLANQSAKGAPSAPGVLIASFGTAILLAIVAVLTNFPGAQWGIGTFGVAYLPGLTLATVISVLRTRRA
ncbi:MAG: hypothetical protein ACHQ2E_09380 [Gemmatimonadales bacterium]